MTEALKMMVASYEAMSEKQRARLENLKARERILGAIRCRLDGGRKFFAWHKGVDAWSHDEIEVTGLPTGQAVLKLFKEFPPTSDSLWYDAKLVFPNHYKELG